MIAINMEMPKGCWYSTKLKLSGVTTCPLKIYCDEKRIKTSLLDARPDDCPLIEIVTCKDCNYCRSNLVEGITCYWCDKDNCVTSADFYCANAERAEIIHADGLNIEPISYKNEVDNSVNDPNPSPELTQNIYGGLVINNNGNVNFCEHADTVNIK